MGDILVIQLRHPDEHTMEPHAASVLCVLKHPATAECTHTHSHTYIQSTHSTTVTPAAGGVGTRTGPGPAVEGPANGREPV